MIDGRESAEDDLSICFLTLLSNCGEIFLILRERDMCAVAIDAEIICAEEDDDEVGLMVDDIPLNPPQALA